MDNCEYEAMKRENDKLSARCEELEKELQHMKYRAETAHSIIRAYEFCISNIFGGSK